MTWHNDKLVRDIVLLLMHKIQSRCTLETTALPVFAESIKYGKDNQAPSPLDDSSLLNEVQKKHVQQIDGHKPLTNVPYKCTFWHAWPRSGARRVREPDCCRVSSEVADAPRHNLELTLEVILEHKLRITTMTLVFSPGSHSKSSSLPRN